MHSALLMVAFVVVIIETAVEASQQLPCPLADPMMGTSANALCTEPEAVEAVLKAS